MTYSTLTDLIHRNVPYHHANLVIPYVHDTVPTYHTTYGVFRVPYPQTYDTTCIRCLPILYTRVFTRSYHRPIPPTYHTAYCVFPVPYREQYHAAYGVFPIYHATNISHKSHLVYQTEVPSYQVLYTDMRCHIKYTRIAYVEDAR